MQKIRGIYKCNAVLYGHKELIGPSQIKSEAVQMNAYADTY